MIEAYQWKCLALGITASTENERVQSSGNQQKMASAIDKYVDIEKEINADIDRLFVTKQEVIKTIEQLPATEYDVLHMLYIQNKEYSDIELKYNRSYSSITTIHGRALAKLQKILDERECYG